jgi:dynein heavy chain
MMENANITYQAQETDKILGTVKNIKTSVVNIEYVPISSFFYLTPHREGALTPDQQVMELVDKFLDPESGVPEIISLLEIYSGLIVEDENGLKPSLTTVLLQEVDRFNILLRVVRESLASLKKAIIGTVVMSQDLDEVYQSFLKQKVPELWATYAYPSLKGLNSWIIDLRKRVDFMNHWVEKGNPHHYWMPGFFFPQGFLTGVLQTYARENQIPIDKLKFEFVVSEFQAEDIVDYPEVSKLTLFSTILTHLDGRILHFGTVPRWSQVEQENFGRPRPRYSLPCDASDHLQTDH